MALSYDATRMLQVRYPTYAAKWNVLTAIPGLEAEFARGFSLVNEASYLNEEDGNKASLGSTGLAIMDKALNEASTNPVGFVKSNLLESMVSGNNDLATNQVEYLQQNNVPISDINNLWRENTLKIEQGQRRSKEGITPEQLQSFGLAVVGGQLLSAGLPSAAGGGGAAGAGAGADPYALSTTGGGLTSSAGPAFNPYTAALPGAAATGAGATAAGAAQAQAGIDAATAAGAGATFPAAAGTAAAAAATPSWMTPAAIVGSSLIGANAAQTAAKTQSDAAAQANQLLAQMYATQRADLAPFTAAGVGAQNKLLTYLGLPGGTEGADYGKYTKDFTGADLLAGQDPGYGFRLAEGQKALERSAAARGGLLSGGTGKALASYGQQMGSQEYQNAYNRYQTNRSNQLAPLFTLTGSGQASAANQAAASGNYATGAANNLTSAGAARAAGDVGTANALTSGLGSYLNYSGQQDLLAAYNERTRQSAYRS